MLYAVAREGIRNEIRLSYPPIDSLSGRFQTGRKFFKSAEKARIAILIILNLVL